MKFFIRDTSGRIQELSMRGFLSAMTAAISLCIVIWVLIIHPWAIEKRDARNLELHNELVECDKLGGTWVYGTWDQSGSKSRLCISKDIVLLKRDK